MAKKTAVQLIQGDDQTEDRVINLFRDFYVSGRKALFEFESEMVQSPTRAFQHFGEEAIKGTVKMEAALAYAKWIDNGEWGDE